MNEELKKIEYSFSGKLIGNKYMKRMVCKAVLALPKTIQKKVTQTCWFVSSFDDAWAFAFTGNDLRNQHLIFLSDDLLSQPESQIIHTIIHEVGHVVLKHRNPVFERQTKHETEKQEREAEDFTKEYVA